jgi:hypothetical protein
VIITPKIKNHLSSIERGEVIGLISSQSLKPTDCKLNNIILCPLVINQHSVKIEIKIYFLKKRERIIEEFISVLVSSWFFVKE